MKKFVRMKFATIALASMTLGSCALDDSLVSNEGFIVRGESREFREVLNQHTTSIKQVESLVERSSIRNHAYNKPKLIGIEENRAIVSMITGHYKVSNVGWEVDLNSKEVSKGDMKKYYWSDVRVPLQTMEVGGRMHSTDQ